MDTTWHLEKFQHVADHLDKEGIFIAKKLEYKVGVWLQSVAVKLQKSTWRNNTPTAKPFQESIFFSIWLNDASIQEGKLLYNIHALQLRQLAGYTIKSREFADAFRLQFKPFEKEWPNVRVDFGPLTLMEGWVPLKEETLEEQLIDLARKFTTIAFMIDDLLEERKKASSRT